MGDEPVELQVKEETHDGAFIHREPFVGEVIAWVSRKFDPPTHDTIGVRTAIARLWDEIRMVSDA